MHIHTANTGQDIPLHRHHRDKKSPFSLRTRNKLYKLLGVSGFAKEDKNIAAGQNADIAMKGIDWGEEVGGDAERDEGLRDLPGYEAGLADAGEEDGAGGNRGGFK